MRMLILAALVAAAAAVFPAPAEAQRGARTVLCESRDNRSYSCRIGEHRRVELVRRISDRRCIEGRTWWVRSDRIVVAGGCRAEFAVYGGGGYAYGRGRGADDVRHDGRHDYDRDDRYREERSDRYDDRRYDRDDDRRYDQR